MIRRMLGSVDVSHKWNSGAFVVGMGKSKVSNEEWAKLAAVLKKVPGIRTGCEATCCRFAYAVL